MPTFYFARVERVQPGASHAVCSFVTEPTWVLAMVGLSLDKKVTGHRFHLSYHPQVAANPPADAAGRKEQLVPGLRTSMNTPSSQVLLLRVACADLRTRPKAALPREESCTAAPSRFSSFTVSTAPSVVCLLHTETNSYFDCFFDVF